MTPLPPAQHTDRSRAVHPVASVIISTYNRPAHLERTLAGFLCQGTDRFEILIADDGSGPETARVVGEATARSPVPIRHVRHEDRGFRLARIRNLAVREAVADCLIFNDDDCIPFSDLVERFAHAHRPGRFSINRVLYLDQATTARIDPGMVRRGAHERLAPPPERRKLLVERAKNAVYIAWGRQSNRPVLVGNSFAVHRGDLLAINGFDEAYEGWGQEDDDLSRRLRAAGVRPMSLIGRARVVHQHHTRTQWHPVRRRHGANISYHERGCVLTRCLRGIAPRAVSDLSFALAPGGGDLADRLRNDLGSRVEVRPRGAAEVEIRWAVPADGRPDDFHPRSQVRVLVVPEDRRDRPGSTGRPLIVPLADTNPAAALLTALERHLSPDSYRPVENSRSNVASASAPA